MPHPFRTVCVGRFLIDLPDNARPAISASYHWLNPHTPVRIDSFASLERELSGRADQNRAIRMIRSPDDDSFWRAAGRDPDKIYAVTQLVGFDADSALQQVVLSYHPEPDNPAVMTEVHKAIGATDYAFDTKDYGADDYPKARQLLWTAATQFQSLTPGEIPNGPGFCVEGGMFADAGKPPVREDTTLVVEFGDHPDLRFVIDASTIKKVDNDEPSLKHRVDGELAVLRAGIEGHVGVLDRGALTAAGQDGYQIGVSAPYDLVPNTRMRKFFWSADGVPNDVTRPFMEIYMTVQPTDDGKSTIQDDKQAKALWQQLMQDIRIRPGAT